MRNAIVLQFALVLVRVAEDGNPDVQTPNLDRLGPEGMIFDNFYATTAICMGSRASVITGMYEFKTGCNFDHGDMKPEVWRKSYPVLLREAGGVGSVSDARADRCRNPFPELNQEMPFFLFMSCNAPHLDLEAPKETIAKFSSQSMTKIPGVKPRDRAIYGPWFYELELRRGQLLAEVGKLGLADKPASAAGLFVLFAVLLLWVLRHTRREIAPETHHE